MACLKLLCLCQGGNSRSAGLAYVLKYGYGHDALAVGWHRNSDKTRAMLYKWADRIFIVQAEFMQYVPEPFRKKVTVYELGPDIWFNSLHPDLTAKCDALIQSDPTWLDYEDTTQTNVIEGA